MLSVINPNLDNSKIILNDKEFLKLILSIPVRKSSYFSLYSNNFNCNEVLEDCYEELIDMYRPFIEKFSKYVKYEGNEIIINNCLDLREELIQDIPSILISGLIVHDEIDLNRLIINSDRLSQLKANYDIKIRNAFVNRYTLYKQIFMKQALIRILKKHSYSRVFFIFFSKWFFIGFWATKFLIKVLVLFYLYKKSGKLHIPFISNNKYDH